MQDMRDQRGFALPLTILVITVMTMLIASAHVRARADRIIAESSGATVTAFAVAQSGLNRYLAYYDSIKVRPADGDSLRINVPGGYADVRAYTVRSPSDTMEPELYVLRSTGTLIQPTRGSLPQAQRTLAQFAQWQSASMWVEAAYTAANDITVDPTLDIDVVGFDQCASGAPAVTGLRTIGTSSITALDFGDLEGSPALQLSGSGAVVANDTRIDWSAIVNGQFEADYDSIRNWDFSYPTMLINGDATISDGGGYGLLMVTGNLTLTGSTFNWRGIVLAGGWIVANAQSTYVRGTIVSGLNAQLGMSPAASQIGVGPFHDFDYDACEIQNALNSLIGFAPIRNAWIDNWAMY
jgi:hypothetical protein